MFHYSFFLCLFVWLTLRCSKGEEGNDIFNQLYCVASLFHCKGIAMAVQWLCNACAE